MINIQVASPWSRKRHFQISIKSFITTHLSYNYFFPLWYLLQPLFVYVSKLSRNFGLWTHKYLIFFCTNWVEGSCIYVRSHHQLINSTSEKCYFLFAIGWLSFCNFDWKGEDPFALGVRTLNMATKGSSSSAAASASGDAKIKRVLTHGGKYAQYNVYGNLFEVSSKYVPPIRPIGRGVNGIVW